MNTQKISKDFPLILASSSPRRKILLKQVGIPFRALPSNIEEDMGPPNLPISPSLLASRKAEAVRKKASNKWILGADTVVVIGETNLGKPKDFEEAESMLSRLSGKEHKVVTGFCLLDPTGHTSHLEEITTLVNVKELSEQEIRDYIATGEPFGKAGSYGIQGIGAFMVETITGSYSNVVGLPLCTVIKALCAAGALESFPITPETTHSA